jgi:prepilin-type N-terminal cleavage/methylation domain-containing protein
MRKGFTLMESLLSLSLTLIIVLAGYEFFGVSRAFFFRLKDRSEQRQAALAALDMIREDVRRAGQGLSVPIGLGLVSGLEAEESRLHVDRCEKDLGLTADVQPGQTILTVRHAEGLKQKRLVCLVQAGQGQVLEISRIQDKTLTVNPAAEAFYKKEEACLLLLETVDYSLDRLAGVVRRKENNGSGQPLLEEAALLDCISETASRLTTIRLAVQPQREKVYETWILPKNLASVFQR